jgi:ribosomal protein S18 acetylase RimI-like enzyme
MDIHFRLATIEDAEDFQYIKQTVWPDESADLGQIQLALSLADHTCYIAEADKHVIGFMDCFATENNDTVRMEMDLLAVLPQYQGNRIASRLIRHCLYHPHIAQPSYFRSLIRTDNIASQKSFEHNGFRLQPEVMTLFIATNKETVVKQKIFSGTILSIHTLNYGGYWIEAPFKKGNLTFPEVRETIGTILPQDAELQKRAEQAGFSAVGNYQWWILPTPLPPVITHIAN